MTDRPEHIRGLADDGTGGLDTSAQIEADILTDMQTMGTVITDVGDLPGDASIRLAGRFTDSYDARTYLELGGLTAWDDQGDNIPLPWVYFMSSYDEIVETQVYQVYIRETSE